jgi:hypothetical protein
VITNHVNLAFTCNSPLPIPLPIYFPLRMMSYVVHRHAAVVETTCSEAWKPHPARPTRQPIHVSILSTGEEHVPGETDSRRYRWSLSLAM